MIHGSNVIKCTTPNILAVPIKITKILPFNPTIPFWRIYSTDKPIHVQNVIYKVSHCNTVCANNPSVRLGDWSNKLVQSHSCCKKTKKRPYVLTWKNMYCVIFKNYDVEKNVSIVCCLLHRME